MATNNQKFTVDPELKLAAMLEKEMGVKIPAPALKKFLKERWEEAAYLAHAFRRQNRQEVA